MSLTPQDEGEEHSQKELLLYLHRELGSLKENNDLSKNDDDLKEECKQLEVSLNNDEDLMLIKLGHLEEEVSEIDVEIDKIMDSMSKLMDEIKDCCLD